MTWLAMATVYVVWGSTYLAIRVVVDTMPPLLSGGARFMLAGAIFWLVLRLRGGAARVRIGRRELLGAFIVGALLLLGGNGFVSVAEQSSPSGLAALIMGAIPLWVALERGITGDRPSNTTLVGVAVGFLGLAVLVLPGDRPGDAALWAVLLLLLASFCWGTGSFLSPRLEMPSDPMVSTAWQMLLGGTLTTIVGLAVGEAGDVDFAAFSSDSILAFFYLVFIGSLVAFTAYTWLLQNAPISIVATYAFVNPLVAVFLGAVILDEEITVMVVIGALAIVSSVWAVVTQETEKAAHPAEPGACPTTEKAAHPAEPGACPTTEKAAHPAEPGACPTPADSLPPAAEQGIDEREWA
jgi:drug/metabolite transporter (DMT)-like permease